MLFLILFDILDSLHIFYRKESQKWQKPKILVVGSFVMDQIATTEVFPREGQTVLGGTFSKAPGGKGANQAVQMARLGADVTMVGKLGHDSNGEDMVKTCKEAGHQYRIYPV